MHKMFLVLLISLFLTSCNNIDISDSVDVDKNMPTNEVLAIEDIIEECRIPFTILRVTQFHNFVLNIINNLENFDGIINVPEGMRFQSIDVREVAGYLVELIKESAYGRLPGRGGPEILDLGEMIKSYLEISGSTNTFKLSKIKSEMNDLFSSGINLIPSSKYGKITWREFLKTQFPPLK